MPDTGNHSKEPCFKSPLSKLAAFFRTSRNKWKSKYMEAKKTIKRKTDQVRYYKNRNAHLKRKIRKLENEISELEKKTPKRGMS